MSAPAAEPNAFTTREQEIMACAWLCFEGEPKVRTAIPHPNADDGAH